MRIKQAIMALFAVALALPASAENTQGITDTTIKIGNLGPFSGPQSTFTPLMDGRMFVPAELAVHGDSKARRTRCTPTRNSFTAFGLTVETRASEPTVEVCT